ncbi:MAG: Holliday junction branch migration protein RuvA [Gammaproteobacteria bacterium]|nr:Holliday junction branch migration protein RuvA [Gammaproteobacteria bacterium]
MIGRLKGIILEKQAPDLLLDVAGIGYEVQAPMSTFYQLPEIGKSVILHTHLVVREDAQLLYGFISKSERSLFRELIKSSGVGPKLALTILSGMDPDLFVQVVIQGDLVALTKLPGVGKKTAERLLVEMRGRLKDWNVADMSSVADSAPASDALSALLALGYRSQDANRVVAKYKNQQLSSEEIIKLALKDLM